MERLLQVTDVPFLPENLALIQDHADDVAKYPQLTFVDLFLRQQGSGGSSETPTPAPKIAKPTPKAHKAPATP
jgi:hypothetical protein